jgi:hypothetical protein
MVLKRSATVGWVIVFFLVLTLSAMLARQRITTANLKSQLEARRGDLDRFAELRRDNARLRAAGSANAAVPSGESPALVRARTELNVRRRELEALSKREAAVVLDNERLTVGKVLSASEWRNAGRATPQGALETTLWAAAGGDIAEFANSLTFIHDGSERAAQALLDSLPAPERDRYRTPAGLIAALTIPEIPTGSAEVREWGDRHAFDTIEQTSVSLLLSSPGGAPKSAMLVMFHLPDGWRLVVSKSVIAKYAAQLHGAPVAAK